MKILLADLDHPLSRIIGRFESVFQYRTGIFSTIARLRRLYENADFVYLHPHHGLEQIYSKQIAATGFRDAQSGKAIISQIESTDTTHQTGTENLLLGGFIERRNLIESKLRSEFDEVVYSPTIGLLDDVAEKISADLFLLDRNEFEHRDAEVIGSKQDLWLHQTGQLSPGVIFNTTNGPIVIDRDCKITPFTYIEGPFYAAPKCHLDNVRITGGTILGDGCRVGGEIENSIFGRYSNKHHEGFVGHSIIGNWVNLGALTTTSDLKNNYGQVRLQLPVDRFPSPASAHETLNTQTIKFGSVLGDCVKTAIGTMLNTGTVIDAGSNIFGGSPPAYVPPLSWGITGRGYLPGRFLEDSEKIFARRDQMLHPGMNDLVALLSHLI